MGVLAGGCLGFVVGVGVWLIVHHFVTHYRALHSQEHPNGGRPLLGEALGFISLPAALTFAGMALWGAHVGWRAPGLGQVVAALLVTGLLLAISLVDFQVRRIPNPLVLVLLVWAMVQALWLGRPALVAAGLGLLVGGGLFLLLALIGRGAMGLGDVKLAAVLGAVLGFPSILPALLVGAAAGGVAALALLVTRRVGRKDYMAYGPYLALGAWIVWTQSWGLWL